jgi:hypothetical protein
MKVPISNDWCERMAQLEGNAEIGAGLVSHPLRTIPGTADDYSRCDYDELCAEAQDGINAIISAHTAGEMTLEVMTMLLRFIGLCDRAVSDMIADAARLEGHQD